MKRQILMAVAFAFALALGLSVIEHATQHSLSIHADSIYSPLPVRRPTAKFRKASSSRSRRAVLRRASSASPATVDESWFGTSRCKKAVKRYRSR